jgi:beta-galactosidase
MIFIANYWANSSNTTVIVYTNCDNVELRLDDKLIVNGGKQKDQNSSHLLRPPFIFHIDQFIPGRLEAIGFLNGKSVVRTYRSTPRKIPHHLGIEIDFSGKPLTNNDVVFVYVYIYDENNTVIPNAADFIRFSFSDAHGQALFIGENPVRAEAGIASILLKTNSVISCSKITVIASSSTVQEKETKLTVDITH